MAPAERSLGGIGFRVFFRKGGQEGLKCMRAGWTRAAQHERFRHAQQLGHACKIGDARLAD